MVDQGHGIYKKPIFSLWRSTEVDNKNKHQLNL
jgi:hypothetical protein